MTSWPFTTTTLKRFNSKGINKEQLKTARKKTTTELRKLTCRGSNSPSYTSYALLVVSLLGGNRNHVTCNCENPQLRNAQLPDKAMTFCACANSYISCAWMFAGAFAYFCVNSCYLYLLPLKVDVLGNYPPEKIQKTNWEYTCFYEGECAWMSAPASVCTCTIE